MASRADGEDRVLAGFVLAELCTEPDGAGEPTVDAVEDILDGLHVAVDDGALDELVDEQIDPLLARASVDLVERGDQGLRQHAVARPRAGIASGDLIAVGIRLARRSFQTVGSDVLAHRPDWKIFDNPFGNDDPIVLLPALKPDVVLFHAALADRTGNVFIGTQRELVAMAHAAQRTVVTVEKIYEGDLLRDPLLAAGSSAQQPIDRRLQLFHSFFKVLRNIKSDVYVSLQGLQFSSVLKSLQPLARLAMAFPPREKFMRLFLASLGLCEAVDRSIACRRCL